MITNDGIGGAILPDIDEMKRMVIGGTNLKRDDIYVIDKVKYYFDLNNELHFGFVLGKLGGRCVHMMIDASNYRHGYEYSLVPSSYYDGFWAGRDVLV